MLKRKKKHSIGILFEKKRRVFLVGGKEEQVFAEIL